MKRILAIMVGVLTLVGLTSGVATSSATESSIAALNCQHSSGDGAVRSAGYIDRYSDNAHLGAVQLCKDGSSRYWGYMVMYSPMPSGKWGNAYLEVYWNGAYQATYSCEGWTSESQGNKHVARGQTMCWTPKVFGTNTSWTYYVYALVCTGVFDDTRNCDGDGATRFTFR